jgi:putative DNA methylase
LVWRQCTFAPLRRRLLPDRPRALGVCSFRREHPCAGAVACGEVTKMSILGRVRWTEVDRDVRIQQTNREKHSPVISGFRWWARRAHAVVGALLDAAAAEFGDDEFLVADPFSGGGTVAFEATRRGLAVYAQDLYPWPTFALASLLRPIDPDEFAEAGQELLASLAPHRVPYQRGGDSERWEATHVLRVRVVLCPGCCGDIHLFPEPLVSVASRGVHENAGFFGCVVCGAASRAPLSAESFECAGCSREAPTGKDTSLAHNVLLRCPHCMGDVPHSAASGTTPRWRPVLVQERLLLGDVHTATVLRAVSTSDPVANADEEPAWLGPRIPHGVETNHLLASGFRRWSDIYTRRQLRMLTGALEAVRGMNRSRAIRDRLAVAVLGCCEMPAYLCRWDRYHPKAFEATANHRYARATVVVETNLLSPIGRGTLPRRLEASTRALSWLQEQEGHATRVDLCSGGTHVKLSCGEVKVKTGSSTNQALPDGSVRLVLTDPPYHDDVQYGELARPFHAFLAAYGGEETQEPKEEEEATPNAIRGDDTRRYEDVVAGCLAESHRVLSGDGRLILTFHNNDLSAWEALGNALTRAGFAVAGLAVVEAENPSDHSKRGRKTFLCDLVMECVPLRDGGRRGEEPMVSGAADTEQRKNLLAVGLSLSEQCNRARHEARDESLKDLYLGHLRRLGAKEVLIR